MSEDGIFTTASDEAGQSATQAAMAALDNEFDENKISDEERAELGEPSPPEKKPCPECGKNLTWLADGSRPRRHKCVDKPDVPTQAEDVQPAAPTPGGVTMDMVVEAYVGTRDEISAIKKECDDKIAKLNELQDKRASWMQGQLTALGVTSMRTAHGTCFGDFKDSATVTDGNVFLGWVHADWETRKSFLENRVSKAAVKQLMADGQTPPPGVNYTKIKSIKVRRS